MPCLILIGFGGVGLQIKLENRTKLFVGEGTCIFLRRAVRFTVFRRSICRHSFVSRSDLVTLETIAAKVVSLCVVDMKTVNVVRRREYSPYFRK